MNKKTIISALAVICVASIGGYEYWKYEDKKNREAAHQAAQDSLVLDLAADPTIEYGEEITDPEALAMSYVTKSAGDVTVANADSLDSMKIGTVNLTYTVSTQDTYGVEVSESKDLTVTVKDTQAPEITLASDTVSIQEGSTFEPLANVTAVKDPVDGDLDMETLTVENTVNTDEPGDYTVTVAAADDSGNTTDVAYAVTVTPKPVVKKTTTAASSSGSTNSYAAPAQGSTDTYVAAIDTTSGQNAGSSTTSDSSTVSSGDGDWRNTLPGDVIGRAQEVYDAGMDHYGEGVAWGANFGSDGSLIWEQPW